ncbi:EAL domain-containing protein [Rhabdothermincola salaria]|uniref:EAL domain-containing protein n=1 Tax=Rhabdothermincola salaria TaxID=2903142 RepID=UPI003D2C6C34
MRSPRAGWTPPSSSWRSPRARWWRCSTPSTATLQALRAMGVRVAIDDFGTGYSSLAYLKRLEIDELKIDRSFVVDLPNDDDVALVGAICGVARLLGIEVVAEGVETEQQRATLLGLDCELAQGFLWSPAVPPHRFTPMLQAPPTS